MRDYTEFFVKDDIYQLVIFIGVFPAGSWGYDFLSKESHTPQGMRKIPIKINELLSVGPIDRHIGKPVFHQVPGMQPAHDALGAIEQVGRLFG
jgi:hypothetical protein